jgi:endoglucanase
MSSFLLVLLAIASVIVPIGGVKLPLSVMNDQVVDGNGSVFQFRCANWAGHMESNLPEGLQHQPLQKIVNTLASSGFNCVRLNYAVEIFSKRDMTARQSLRTSLNGALAAHVAPFEAHNPELIDLPLPAVFEAVVNALASHNLLVLMSNHVSKAGWCCSFTDGNGWFNEGHFDVASWISSLSSMATLLSRYPTVVAFDLRNELRTNIHNRARQISDWMRYFPQGINALNRANPNALIFVSALDYDLDFSFLDEGLNSEQWNDVSERLRHRLVFEAHIYTWSGYGNPTDDCNEMLTGFQRRLGWPLRNNRPLVISEFGLDVNSFPENTKTDIQWLNCVKRFVVEQKLGYAHWILDGSYYLRDGQLNNKENYGLLEADWSKMKKNGIFVESLKTMDWIGGESHWDCYHQSDMTLVGRVEIWWGHKINDAVWACNAWVPECDGACVIKSPWDCYRQTDLMWVGRVEIWWGHEEDQAVWACNSWVSACAGSCNVKSYWDCHRQSDMTLVGRVAIWWGHKANDAVWACNAWVPECNGVCNVQTETPTVCT